MANYDGSMQRSKAYERGKLSAFAQQPNGNKKSGEMPRQIDRHI